MNKKARYNKKEIKKLIDKYQALSRKQINGNKTISNAEASFFKRLWNIKDKPDKIKLH